MNTASVALILAAIALGAAGYALTRESPTVQRAPVRVDRVTELEMRIEELTREVAMLRSASPRRREPDARAGGPAAIDGGSTSELPEDETALAAIVDDAVDRKTKQVIDELRIKANKKPAMEVFASMIELTREQRESAERVVVEGQRELHRILGTTTADGTNLMDELVEIMASGIAQPGKDHGFGRWVGRVMNEKIPGTNDTYATRIEALKNSMRATFEKEWTAEQYKEFKAWGVDPTEIDKVPGSPNELLGKRIMERAAALGAEVPEAK